MYGQPNDADGSKHESDVSRRVEVHGWQAAEAVKTSTGYITENATHDEEKEER
jgi:deoxyribose-phosphate aldolase